MILKRNAISGVDTVDELGFVIKNARLQAGMTRKELADKLCFSIRHLMCIENNQQKPSYSLLFRLIRELSIPPDLIFYPETASAHDRYREASVLLRQCDEQELGLVIAMICVLVKDK